MKEKAKKHFDVRGRSESGWFDARASKAAVVGFPVYLIVCFFLNGKENETKTL